MNIGFGGSKPFSQVDFCSEKRPPYFTSHCSSLTNGVDCQWKNNHYNNRQSPIPRNQLLSCMREYQRTGRPPTDFPYRRDAKWYTTSCTLNVTKRLYGLFPRLLAKRSIALVPRARGIKDKLVRSVSLLINRSFLWGLPVARAGTGRAVAMGLARHYNVW